MNYRILVINPGSTSTKMGVFDGENCVFQETLRHSADELAPFSHVMEQVDFRRALVEKVLEEKHIAPETLNAVCARGGQIPPCPSGAFVVDKQMCDYLYGVKEAAHASNLGAVIALHIAETQGIPAYVYDPVAVDEMTPMTRITGMPMLQRHMLGHALNCRAMAIRCAKEVMHKPLEECRFIVLHLGGGASARLFIGGKMVDGVRDDEIMFAPERSGGEDCQSLIHLCFSGQYTEKELMKFVRGAGGLKAIWAPATPVRWSSASPPGTRRPSWCTTPCCTARPSRWVRWRQLPAGRSTGSSSPAASPTRSMWRTI